MAKAKVAKKKIESVAPKIEQEKFVQDTSHWISTNRRFPDYVDTIAKEMQQLQKNRVNVIKSKNMQINRLYAIVACSIGYSSFGDEKERKAKYDQAKGIIQAVMDKDPEQLKNPVAPLIRISMLSIERFMEFQDSIEDEMRKLIRQLPIAKPKTGWLNQPEQRGFGEIIMSSVIGECGNLANYSSPSKMWRRMACQPHAFNGECYMGATWRSKKGGLPAEEWVKYGYSPRRRSISFLIGDGLVKMNKSIYRAEYDKRKAEMRAKYEDYSDLRCHRHGMLMATKMLLYNLWLQWWEMGEVIS